MDFRRSVMVIYYGVLILLDILRNVYKFGFTSVFQWKQTERPKCLEDPALGKHGHLTIKDVRIHYVASGPIKGPLMLFLHGFPEFWFSWRHQIREFNKDHRVVAVDMRGYGDSDKPKGIDAYSMRVLISDVKEIIEALGYSTCTLVAHDWGGLVAWPFAKFYPDYVDKLIILNVVPKPVFEFVVPRSRAQQERSWYVTFFQLPWIPELRLKIMNFAALRNIFTAANITDPEIIDAYVYTFSRPGALTPPIDYYRALVRGSGGSFTYDARCNMPVLLIWGCQDNYLGEECVDGLAQLAPDVQIKLIQRANHFVAMEEPETVNRFMRDWLEG